MFFGFVTAQWPMYVPGAPINRSVIPIEAGIYGFAYGPALYSCREQVYRYPCHGVQLPDPSICQNLPPLLSRLPNIKGTAFLLLNQKDSMEIHCGVESGTDETQKAPEGTVLVYTLNGTCPDIYGPSHTPPVTVNYEANEYMFVMARCIEPGKSPSRIAYAERLTPESYQCYRNQGGPWKFETHYKPLQLPQCEAWKHGLENCDGQSIYEPEDNVPAPDVTPPSPPQPQSTPTLPSDTHRQTSSSPSAPQPQQHLMILIVTFLVLFLLL